MSTQLSTFRHTALLVATGLLAASLSLPAFAAVPETAVSAASAPAGAGTEAAPAAGRSTNGAANASTTDRTKYCARTQPVTGSIVSGKVCKTKAGWAAEGVDITEKVR